MAEIFDKKLVDEVSRLTGIGKLPSERLAGWDAFTLKASLEDTQFAIVMMSLPRDHPRRVMYMNDFGPLSEIL